ncbi:MAG TPA: class E sortase [Acidimicrobiales bacterium]|nr:class E sortase [Acidimicrobiales bacterium]HLN42030.1 class E sortase [Acidimicrobiales bacterium]
MRRGLVTGVLGRILLSGGVLILLFVAYQLWGTGIAESHSQAVLRQKFDSELHHVGRQAPSSTTTTTLKTPPTTSASGDQPTVGANTTAPNDGNPVGVLHIGKLGLDKVIVQGTSENDLRQGPGHYPGTPLPGEAGNAAIAGHRTTYGAPFYNLDELHSGDLIGITTVQGSFTYSVTGTLVVSPSDTAVVANTTEAELTLTTCNPRFSASQRLVVHARLITAPAPTLRPPKAGSRRASGTNDLAGNPGGDWVPTLELGLLSTIVIIAVFVVARRQRGRARRWAVYSVGGACSLVALFFFFAAVSPLLPASF